MDDVQIAHIERVASLVDALLVLPWIDTSEAELAACQLLDFDSKYWNFTHYLSRPLYAETEQLLRNHAASAMLACRPQIAVIVPVFQATRALLEPALRSIRQQVGVAIELLISIDGHEPDRDLVDEVLESLEEEFGKDPYSSVRVLVSRDNLGVGQCRNRALRLVASPWFTCLDADDLFHPLRCLHGLMALLTLGVDRLNTSWSRVSIQQKKIILINDRLSTYGHNSFIARSELLGRYGFLAKLRVHEDTEYQKRLEFFGVPMQNSLAIGHYLNAEVDHGYISLSSPLRREVHAIEGHPYLCGSVIYGRDEERRRIEEYHAQLYRTLLADALLAAFPSE